MTFDETGHLTITDSTPPAGQKVFYRLEASPPSR